jgi:hypothetical protein
LRGWQALFLKKILRIALDKAQNARYVLFIGTANPAQPLKGATMAQSLFSTYTNRTTGLTTVMHGTTLCGYVERVADANRKVGFYYAVRVAKGGDVVGSYCAADGFMANVEHVQREWQAGL